MLSERVYRALLALYPAEYRREYGKPMVQLFRDRMRREGSGYRTTLLWMRMVIGLVGSALAERAEKVMLASATVKRSAVRSGEFLLWSLIGAIGLYMVTTLAVVIASIVSVKTGFHTFTMASGFFLMYQPDNTFVIHDRSKFSFEFDLILFLVLVVAAGLLTGAALAMRSLRMSLRS